MSHSAELRFFLQFPANRSPDSSTVLSMAFRCVNLFYQNPAMMSNVTYFSPTDI